MRFKIAILIAISHLSMQLTFAQDRFSKVQIDRQFKDTLSFINHWDFPVGVFKDDSTGEITNDGGFGLLDTTHLFFTASCTTNVQGGYEIRYCFASKTKENIVLTFSDGLPAYASEYYVFINRDSFYFRPKTIYPMRIPGEKISYQVTKQKLTLNKDSYPMGEAIIGHLDAEFIETVTVPNKKTQSHKFYVRGFFKTPLLQGMSKEP